MATTHADAVKKPTADDIINDAKLYDLVGIDIERCAMPAYFPAGNMGRGAMATDEYSVGHQIEIELKPALDDLIRGMILQKKASFFDAQIQSSKNRVAMGLTRVSNAVRMASDSEGAIRLAQSLSGSIVDYNERVDALVGNIVQAVSERISALDITTAHRR